MGLVSNSSQLGVSGSALSYTAARPELDLGDGPIIAREVRLPSVRRPQSERPVKGRPDRPGVRHDDNRFAEVALYDIIAERRHPNRELLQGLTTVDASMLGAPYEQVRPCLRNLQREPPNLELRQARVHCGLRAQLST